MAHFKLKSVLGSSALVGILAALTLPGGAHAASTHGHAQRHIVAIDAGPCNYTGGVRLWSDGSNNGYCERYSNGTGSRDLTTDNFTGCGFPNICFVSTMVSSVATSGSNGSGYIVCGDSTTSGYVSNRDDQSLTSNCNDNGNRLYINT